MKADWFDWNLAICTTLVVLIVKYSMGFDLLSWQMIALLAILGYLKAASYSAGRRSK